MDYRDDLSAISLAHLRAASGWQQQYKLIIQWGKLIAPKPALRIADNLIRGCEVPVWLAHMPAQGRDYFALDADSSVIKGLASLLLVQVNGKTRHELSGLDLQRELHDLGLEKHLTPSRNNGLNAIIARIYQHLQQSAE
ncbi:sulfur acceptor protein SufE for iron-sulfur cluster assembly [Cellvibrio mixtus]|uniref:Sulfur acceptor protein SufE for iron-sulfur cluster assembly n=1 Tax=Cellvibrio mixtus TaxID=39650 RepID=A0A266Q4E0_9GAMM|nr:SufE family protein [Cellvibrio mixtus]OZY84219.1 sulfur acceptor protein SufE for iron-sulfur cluster assembly [Cellvibrio mixtus]